MSRTHKLVAGGAALLAVVLAGGAIAATRAFSPREERQAVINDAAEQLGVEPQALSDALKHALKNRVDAAVNDGRLTREQATRLKERIDAGDAPLFGLIPGRRFGAGPGFRPERMHGLFHAKFEAAARYLGMTRGQLREALGNGRSLAQIAKDRGKSVDGLVDALVDEAGKSLDRAVENGRITEAEKKEMLSGLRERITDLVNGRFPARPPDPRFGRIEFAPRPPIF